MGGLDRRTLLAGSAAALAAGALARMAPADEKKPPRFKKAVKYGMVKAEGGVLARFELVKALGYDGIELDSPAKFVREEVLQARDATGLKIHGVVDSVHWRLRLSDPDKAKRDQGRAGLETAIRDAAAYGADTVLLVPAVVGKQVAYDQAWERSTAEIRKVLPLAAEKKITIAIENVWNHFLLSPMEAARYVDQFESPYVGWYLDVGNIVNYGWPEQWVRILGKRIVKLDVKEFSRTRRDKEGLWKGFGVEIGDGDCDWPAVREALAEVGYSGWATAEVGGGDRKRLADIKARMDRVLGA